MKTFQGLRGKISGRIEDSKGKGIMVYNKPLYYEIAFSFMNARKQIDSFEKIIKKLSRRKVMKFLDIACGPSLQLLEIAKRGYEAIGLDSSKEMLDYLKKKAKKAGVDIETVNKSMYDFKLKRKADFTFIMLGSLTIESNGQLKSHLASVAASLKKGGLYFIQNNVDDMTKADIKMNWTIKRKGIKVKTIYERLTKNPLRQLYTEKLTLNVEDNDKKLTYIHRKDLKHVFPQEFKELVKQNGKFEFVGWYKGGLNSWELNKPLDNMDKIPELNAIILRRK